MLRYFSNFFRQSVPYFFMVNHQVYEHFCSYCKRYYQIILQKTFADELYGWHVPV